MALYIYTTIPQNLLGAIKKGIDNGHIETWTYDEDGDFTHTTKSGQWNGRAWMHPTVLNGVLRFGMVGQEKISIKKEIYAIYHGRFSEMLLAHFDKSFTEIKTSALLEPGVDRFS